VLLLTVLAAAACGGPSAELRSPDIVLISLDTLRRDHVDGYRDDGAALTPNLRALADESVVFDDAWAQVQFTLPSHMSIFTGLYPDVHGVDRKRSRLGEGVPTLPELLQGAGYHTVGVVTNLWMKGEFGFARGFDHYERLPYGLVYADRVNQRAWELLDSDRDRDRPLFLFLHYIDPHSDFFNVDANALPYYAPPELLSELEIAPDSREFCDDDGNCATDFLLAADREGRPLDRATIDRIAALYGRGVAYLDREIGALVDGLRHRAVWEDALVVVTSDHGEAFREHGRFIHIQPYVEDLAVPLMIKLPGGEAGGRRIAATVETVDYLPTLLEAAGVPAPDHLQGRSLLAAIRGADTASTGRAAFGRDKLDRARYALRLGDFSLVHHTGSGSSELYHRRRDPDEQVDLAGLEPARVAELERRLLEIIERNRELAAAIAAPPSTAADVLTEDDAEKLRAIGYLE
jgi:arylsulfatase A-like enzyme